MAHEQQQNNHSAKLERLNEGGRVVFACRGVLPKTPQLTHTLRIISLKDEKGKPQLWRSAPDLSHHLWILTRINDDPPLVLISLQFGISDNDISHPPDIIARRIGEYIADQILPDLPAPEFGQYIHYQDPISKHTWILTRDYRLRKFVGRIQSPEDQVLIQDAKQREHDFAQTRIMLYVEAIDRRYKALLRR